MRVLWGILVLASTAAASTLESAIDTTIAASEPAGRSWGMTVRLSAWFAGTDGDVTEQGGTVALDDLGVDDAELNVFPQVDVDIGRFRIGFTAIFLKHEENTVAGAAFTYGGVNYAAGEAIFTKFRFDNYDLRVMYRVVDDGGWAVYVGGGASYFNIDVKVQGEIAEGIALPTATIPFLSATVRRTWDRWIVELQLAVMPFDTGDWDGTFVGYQVLVGYVVRDPWRIEAGYKGFLLDGETDGTDFDSLLVGGFFLAVAVEF